MSVAELIEKLKEFPQDARVYVWGGYDCDMPTDPAPEYQDYQEAGVYL